jgi:hypothetical protein
MLPRLLVLAALAGASCCASAQLVPENPDWKEFDAPPPPALRTQGLIPLDVPGSASSLRFGVDPDSVSVGPDSVVRYVVVAAGSSGVTNGIYEGIRCSTGEVKVYARHNPDSGWVPAKGGDWKDLYSVPNARYSLAVARNGACLGRAPNGPAVQIVRDLRAPVDRRFERGGVNR